MEAAHEKEASVRLNGVGELRNRERFGWYDLFCFKQGRSFMSFSNETENWALEERPPDEAARPEIGEFRGVATRMFSGLIWQ
jgi:hypothetical protein